MKLNLLSPCRAASVAAILSAFLTVPARADVEDKITKSFKVQPGGELIVEADRGSIEVKTVAEGEAVDIEVSRKAGGSAAKAERTLKEHVVTTTQDGNKVEVRAEYQGETGWFGRSPELQVNYRITVPRKFEVNLKTAGGGVKVGDLAGKARVRTSGGSLWLEKIEGPVESHTSGGNVSVAGCRGTVDAGTSGGSVNLKDIEGDVTAKTSGGSIRAEKIVGKSLVKTSGGSITVAALKGCIEASTSGGSIHADLVEPPAEACSFKTSGGSITVKLDAQSAVDVDLRTSGGRVSSEFPVATVVQGEQDKNELRGKVNGGGALITARTSGGNVRLEKR